MRGVLETGGSYLAGVLAGPELVGVIRHLTSQSKTVRFSLVRFDLRPSTIIDP